MGKVWTLQDAKNRFSAVVEAARKGEPQRWTKRGVEAVVVLSSEEYEGLVEADAAPKKTFVDHLFDFPKLPGDAQDLFDKKEPMIMKVRDIEFD